MCEHLKRIMRHLSHLLSLAVFSLITISHAAAGISGVELTYKEGEQGVDPYQTRYIATDRYLRIDDLSEDSGYILFDRRQNKIFSVSHFDRSILIIDNNEYERPALSSKLQTTDVELTAAPKIAGHTVYDYQVELVSDDIQELCTRVQYADGLLPEVGRLFHAYQQVNSGNLVKTLGRIPAEYQTPCMLSDQVYNQGEYYLKGIAIMEWHSNGRHRLLENYQQGEFDASLFELPDGYRDFRVGADSAIPITR